MSSKIEQRMKDIEESNALFKKYLDMFLVVAKIKGTKIRRRFASYFCTVT